ncbi:Piso0_004572 [Millerozyma farinosa CBS 7064]|uniref:Alternative oxidase n=1 Tax=Pichia sorbitophila (strain ATCC MYA-4447 / BCRC 22081 / CBS 7064 / NBRC 10061 / NRRL Y-12695) TaxID=559304 RepID=G8Y5U5_PICSO|nr:Piso0_004572 [Millerozyma farinosa CBS 7064]CCE85006.1 Piso0_004572 [Millerozyma farinosa CBS 7064]
MLTRYTLARTARIPTATLRLRYSTSAVARPQERAAAEAVQPPGIGLSTKLIDKSESHLYNDNAFLTEPMFPHPGFGLEETKNIEYSHRVPDTMGDKITYKAIQFVRWSFDFVTGYKKPHTPEEKLHSFAGTRYEMNEGKWLTRVIFLESVAGVPGMVAAFIRHLHSLRLLKRDKAWIETLLDEAYNERMHLLTFMKLGRPSWFTKLIVYIGQGVFCNLFFFAYLVNPKYCHRFVGYLEEEAVSTYSHLLDELDAGKLPRFDEVKIPEISWHYWTELNEHSSFHDLVSLIRADEAKHREVNHTLANLDQKDDRNPFALQIPNASQPQPNNNLSTHRPKGWNRDDLIL